LTSAYKLATVSLYSPVFSRVVNVHYVLLANINPCSFDEFGFVNAIRDIRVSSHTKVRDRADFIVVVVAKSNAVKEEFSLPRRCMLWEVKWIWNVVVKTDDLTGANSEST